mgnify:CR=1 FL=1
MTDRKAEFLALLERYALTVARREGAVDYPELRATEALADELRAELVKFIGDGWISVSERLPDFEVDVLVFCNGVAQWGVRSNNCRGWALATGWADYDDVVTHWMPMPEPPESNTDADNL